MICDEQEEVSNFLVAPQTHGIDGTVDVIDTHISKIFLAGNRVYKLKRAVQLPYADFSTPEIRLAICEKERALNAPHAPGLYLDARRITRAESGGLEFDGPGPLVDAVVEMTRFGQDALFDRMAGAGLLTPDLMSTLAQSIADFHAAAPVVHSGSGAGNIAGVLDINRAGFATSAVFSDAEVKALDSSFRAALERHAADLDHREAQGLVRRCHGDLHLRNICMFENRPTLFDCIEFNDQIATVDVLYDLAFLLMDLWVRDLPELANLVANRYFDAAGTDRGFGLLTFFMALRAAVRAHVIATLVQRSEAKADARATTARRYFEFAHALLKPEPPRAVAIGGLSGTGKTTVSEAMAAFVGAPPGARTVESDRTRKAMYGVPSDTRLPADAYRPVVSEQVYEILYARARTLLDDGVSVVVDAVFDRPHRRAALHAEIAGAKVPIVSIWLEADARALRERVQGRRGGPSDATVDVLDTQLARDKGEITWAHVPASGPVAATVETIKNILRDEALSRES